jgi:hypothetical protein
MKRCLPWILALGGCGGIPESGRTIDGRTYHLGVEGRPEWQEFAGSRPHGSGLEVRFVSQANPAEHTLRLRQDNVKQVWPVRLNGKEIGRLHPQEVPTVLALAVPAGALKDGENVLALVPPRDPDDIRAGPFRIDDRPLAESVGEARLQVLVTDPSTGGGLPARITIADSQGFLPPLAALPGQTLAARPGVVYTGDGHARIGLPAGSYTVTATRGFEYGVDSKKVRLGPGESRQIVLAIRREVSTPSLVACDTHVHTREYSGHGDATADERALTLAGEGVELPITTEHDRASSYEEAAARTGVRERLTPVTGCEVTTRTGHFNIFPVAGTATPDKSLTDWPRIMEAIRATPGVRVAVLNHPRSLHAGFIPFDPRNFDGVTGENLRGSEFTFDALELVNSGALRSDWRQVYSDWFALLNRGYRIVGVGASDSHDVNRFIVGQGRTYLQAPDADPGRIDVEAACRSLLKGRALVSMGLLAQVKVNERFGPGDLATGLGKEMRISVTVSGPSWTQVDRVELYANGVRIREASVPLASLGGEKFKHTWTIARPGHDLHLVTVATGPGVTALHWPIPRPYQPSSPVWKPYVIGSTNPVWVDGDDDGAYLAPRAQAARLVERLGNDLEALLGALAAYDEAVAAQAASLLAKSGKDIRGAEAAALLEKAAEPVRRGFAAAAPRR